MVNSSNHIEKDGTANTTPAGPIRIPANNCGRSNVSNAVSEHDYLPSHRDIRRTYDLHLQFVITIMRVIS